MIKIGIIGCGRITEVRHAPEYAANKNCKIAAFYDFDMSRAERFAKEYGGKACGSIDELLACDIDAVSVCVSNDAHYSTTIKALEAGKHVLCEKPMAMTPEECRSMVELAKAKGLNLMIGLNQRFMKAHVKAKELIDSGEIGKILTFDTHFCHSGPEVWTGQKNTWFFDKNRASLGVMADLGVHKTDLVSYLIGQKFVEATAVQGTIDKTLSDGTPISVEDNAMCLYRTAENVMGTMTVSWTNYGVEDNSTVIRGTKGVLRIYDDPEYTLILEKGNEVTRFDLDRTISNEKQISGGSENTGVINEFVASIQEKRKPLADGASALHAMMAIFADVRSAEEKRTVEIQQ